eukprot:PhM_4_TR14294/c0_g1_i1/m.29868
MFHNDLFRLLDIPFALFGGFFLIMFFKAFSTGGMLFMEIFMGIAPTQENVSTYGLYFYLLHVFSFPEVPMQQPAAMRVVSCAGLLVYVSVLLYRVTVAITAVNEELQDSLGVSQADVVAYENRLAEKQQQQKQKHS